MRMFSALAAIGLMLALAACASPLTALTSATISRHDVLLAIDAANTVEDSATAAMASCLAIHGHTGVCAPAVVNSVHKDLVDMRAPRDQLNAFAQAHGDKQLGVTGLYDAVVAAKDALLGLLVDYGAAAAPS